MIFLANHKIWGVLFLDLKDPLNLWPNLLVKLLVIHGKRNIFRSLFWISFGEKRIFL